MWHGKETVWAVRVVFRADLRQQNGEIKEENAGERMD